MKKLLLIAGATLFMAACSEAPTSPTAPAAKAPGGRANLDLTCRSGYIVAYDQDGNPYCAPDPDGFQAASRPATGKKP